MDKFDDNKGEGTAGPATHNPDDAAHTQTTRRRFSRGALVGSAVLLSLGNRAAWSASSQVVDCMSVMTLNSFDPQTGMFTSAPGARENFDHKPELAQAIHNVGDPPTYLGRDRQYRTCQHPEIPDRVCLVKGPCP